MNAMAAADGLSGVLALMTGITVMWLTWGGVLARSKASRAFRVMAWTTAGLASLRGFLILLGLVS